MSIVCVDSTIPHCLFGFYLMLPIYCASINSNVFEFFVLDMLNGYGILILVVLVITIIQFYHTKHNRFELCDVEVYKFRICSDNNMGDVVMRFKDYSGTEQFRPLSAWAYFGYGLLFAIPIIGWIILIIFTFSTTNYNRRSFARSYWCALFVAGIIIAIPITTGIGADWLYEKVPVLKQWLPEIRTTITTSYQKLGIPTVRETTKVEKTAILPSTKSSGNVGQSNSGITPAFKKTMDSYEAVIDSYIEFMESLNSGKSTMTQIAKGAEMAVRYYGAMEELEKIDESSLSEADEQYFMEVTLRINKKLTSAALK